MTEAEHEAVFEGAARLLLQHQLYNHRFTIPYEDCIVAEEHELIATSGDQNSIVQRLKQVIAVKRQILERLAHLSNSEVVLPLSMDNVKKDLSPESDHNPVIQTLMRSSLAQMAREEQECVQEDERKPVIEGQRATLLKQVTVQQQVLEVDATHGVEVEVEQLKQVKASIKSKLGQLENAFKLIRKTWDAQGGESDGQQFTALLQALMNKHYMAPHNPWIDATQRRKTHLTFLARSGLVVLGKSASGSDLVALNLP